MLIELEGNNDLDARRPLDKFNRLSKLNCEISTVFKNVSDPVQKQNIFQFAVMCTPACETLMESDSSIVQKYGNDIHLGVGASLGMFNRLLHSVYETMNENMEMASFFATDGNVHKFLESVIRFVNREIERVRALPNQTEAEMAHLQKYVNLLAQLLTLGMEKDGNDRLQNRFQMLLDSLKSLFAELMQTKVFNRRAMYVENDTPPPVVELVLRMSRMLGCDFVTFCDTITPVNFRGTGERGWILELIKTWSGRDVRTMIEALDSREAVGLLERMKELWVHVDGKVNIKHLFANGQQAMLILMFKLADWIFECAKSEAKPIHVRKTADLLHKLGLLDEIHPRRVERIEPFDPKCFMAGKIKKLCELVHLVVGTIEDFGEFLNIRSNLSESDMHYKYHVINVVREHAIRKGFLGNSKLKPLKVFDGSLDKFNRNPKLVVDVFNIFWTNHVEPNATLATGSNRSKHRVEMLVASAVASEQTAGSSSSNTALVPSNADAGSRFPDDLKGHVDQMPEPEEFAPAFKKAGLDDKVKPTCLRMAKFIKAKVHSTFPLDRCYKCMEFNHQDPSIVTFKRLPGDWNVAQRKPKNGYEIFNEALKAEIEDGNCDFTWEELQELNVNVQRGDEAYIKVDFGNEDIGTDFVCYQMDEKEICTNFNHVLPLTDLNKFLGEKFKDRHLLAEQSKSFICMFIRQLYGVELAQGNIVEEDPCVLKLNVSGGGVKAKIGIATDSAVGVTLQDVQNGVPHKKQRSFFPGLRCTKDHVFRRLKQKRNATEAGVGGDERAQRQRVEDDDDE